MNIHILCLNILVILFTLSPASLVGTIFNFPGMEKFKNNKNNFFKAFMYLLIFQVICIFIMNSKLFEIDFPKDNMFYIIALIFIPIAILIEIIIGCIVVKLKGNKISKISFFKSNKLDKSIIINTVVIAFIEELLFRQIWINILHGYFEINIYIVILVSSLAYAINHISMGFNVIVQKFVTGVLYAILYLLSGSIIIPIITHCIQNYVVMKVGADDE